MFDAKIMYYLMVERSWSDHVLCDDPVEFVEPDSMSPASPSHPHTQQQQQQQQRYIYIYIYMIRGWLAPPGEGWGSPYPPCGVVGWGVGPIWADMEPI